MIMPTTTMAAMAYTQLMLTVVTTTVDWVASGVVTPTTPLGEEICMEGERRHSQVKFNPDSPPV